MATCPTCGGSGNETEAAFSPPCSGCSGEGTIECLDGPENCAGAVEFRMALSPSGVSFPRCDRHWQLRLDKEEDEESIPWRSDVAPAWFDRSLAGEAWEDA